MLLYLQERLAIMTILAELDQPSLAVFLAKAGVPQIHVFSAATKAAPAIAVDFMDWLEKNPNSLIPTLQRLLIDYGQHDMAPTVHGTVARATAVNGAAPAGLPSQAVLTLGRPMVNRAPLRRALQDHVDQHGSAPPVVMIDGPPGTGRSHSWFLIRHVADQAGIRAIKVDLTAPILENQTLAGIAQTLVSNLGLILSQVPTTVAATPETVAERWAEEVNVAWNARNPARMVWIVLDSLDRPLAPEVRAFVCALAARRLDHVMTDCVFFLLGAGQDYGVDDPGRLVARETLTVFRANEVEQAARELAAQGRKPLSKVDLDKRIADLVDLLSGGNPREVCMAVHAKFADLRVEVSA